MKSRAPNTLIVAMFLPISSWSLCLAQLYKIWRRGDVCLLPCCSHQHNRICSIYARANSISSKSDMVLGLHGKCSSADSYLLGYGLDRWKLG